MVEVGENGCREEDPTDVVGRNRSSRPRGDDRCQQRFARPSKGFFRGTLYCSWPEHSGFQYVRTWEVHNDLEALNVILQDSRRRKLFWSTFLGRLISWNSSALSREFLRVFIPTVLLLQGGPSLTSPSFVQRIWEIYFKRDPVSHSYRCSESMGKVGLNEPPGLFCPLSANLRSLACVWMIGSYIYGRQLWIYLFIRSLLWLNWRTKDDHILPKEESLAYVGLPRNGWWFVNATLRT